jgi:hypothetical protein
VEPEQNHSIHFDVHNKDVQAHLQEPNANPMEMLQHLEKAGPHMAQHLNALRGDPTRKVEVKEKQKQLDMMGKISDKLGQNVKEAMQARAKAQPPNGQQPPDPEAMAKVMKVKGELGLKAEKLKGDMALKERKQQHSEVLQDKKTAAGIRRENAKTKAELLRPRKMGG